MACESGRIHAAMAYNGSKSGLNGSIHGGIFIHGEQRPRGDERPREDERPRDDKPPAYYFENGRAYQTFCKERYMLPCDEEEMDRMDIFHKFFQVAREKDTPFGSLHQLPLPAQPRILDLGCGTGIWAIDMADRYNSSGVVAAEVIGWDLALIQPQRIPPGLMFEKRDAEDMPWRGVNRDCFDLIHLQMLLGSIGNWPALYGQILRHLKPGSGILEQVEIDLRPRSEKGELPGNTKLSLWTRELSEAFGRAGTPLGMDPKTQALLEDLGFVDVKQETKRVPCNAWPDDEQEKDMGRWFNLALTQGLQAMSYGPLTRKLHYNKDQVDALVAEVRREICDRNIRAYCTMHIWTARRPGAGGQRP